MKIRIELSKDDVCNLIITEIERRTGQLLDVGKLTIEVTRQNYKSEWEDADFRAVYSS